MGIKKKINKSGAIINFISRSRALKKLDISLKDFRKLCILKGIYPSAPKKKLLKKYGTKTKFYQLKDILNLIHEPLLIKIKQARIYLKKIQKALNRKDLKRVLFLKKNKPEFTCDHLIRERYPNFIDAVRDLDDCLSMIHLFSMLPSGSTNELTGKRVFKWQRLRDEFQAWCVRKKCIQKAFVSIKGTYIQISLYGTDVIFLMPHEFVHEMPNNVDYNVMSTFLFFYETLLKFINFRLYNEMGLLYPPFANERLSEIGFGFTKFTLEVNIKKLYKEKSIEKIYRKKNVDRLEAILKNVPENSTRKEQVEIFDQCFSTREMTPFKKMYKYELVKYLDEKGYLFKDLYFLLNREVPQNNLEFLIQGAGGQTSRFQAIANFKDNEYTHHVADHSIFINKYLINREYIQPQWIFDCLNVNSLLPIQPYTPGAICPPHLSPFNNEKEGYLPKQTLVLEAWKNGKQYKKKTKGSKKCNKQLAWKQEKDQSLKRKTQISILKGKKRRLMKAIELAKVKKRQLIFNLEKKRKIIK